VRLFLRALLATTCVSVLLAGPAVAASGYPEVLRAYESQGTVPPCQFSAGVLQRALRGVDVYGQQYFADFTGAIQAALAQRAAGQCTPSAAATATGGVRNDPTLRVALPSVTAPTGSGLPLPLLALLILGLAAGLLALAEGVRRRLALDAGPGGAWRQLWGETAWRSEGWLTEQRESSPAQHALEPGVSRSGPRPSG
jgi:hypothetical protein